MHYINFSEDDLYRANNADLASYLTRHGERVKRVGSILGTACMMDGMIGLFRETLGDAKVIATGGLAGTVVPHCKTKGIIHDDRLLLDGLYDIYKLNA